MTSLQLDRDKLRGGYYTTPKVAGWLSEWAVRSNAETRAII